MPRRRPPAKIDILTLMDLLEKVGRGSKHERLTTARILRLTRMGSLHTVYGYVRFACDRGLMRVVTIWDGRPYGPAKYYYVTEAGKTLLQTWKRTTKNRRRL
jgi:hypothetical protein